MKSGFRKAGKTGSWDQSHVPVKRRTQFKGTGLPRKVIHTEQIPIFPSFLCNSQFISGHVKWGSLPAIRSFHFYEPLLSFWSKTCDVKSRSITFFFGNPAYFGCRIISSVTFQYCTLVPEPPLFTRTPQDPIKRIASGNIKFARDMQHLLQFFRFWSIG